MGLFSRTRGGHALTEGAADVVHQSVGGRLTAIVSGFALIFSGISLYQSVLKQPALQLYVPPVIHYTRDANGNYEVFAIPVTIANHGARDGAVLSIDLDVQTKDGKTLKNFYSAYFVGNDYFANPPGYDSAAKVMRRPKRPKSPYAPISVAGRTSYSGTILFYAKSKPFPKVVSGKGRFVLKLELNTRLDNSLGFFDNLWRTRTAPIKFETVLPHFSESSLLRGGTVRMNNAAWASSVGEAVSKRE